MLNDFHQYTLILSALFLPAFGYLYLRFRDVRTLLWVLAFLAAMAGMVLLDPQSVMLQRVVSEAWDMALGQAALQISAALFLGSLSPKSVRLGRLRVLYAILYAIPMVAIAILFYGICDGHVAGGPMYYVLPAIGVIAFVVAAAWSTEPGSIPVPLSVTVNVLVGGLSLWVYATRGTGAALHLAGGGNFLVAALLILCTFRRLTPGVLLTMAGFLAWAVQILLVFPAVESNLFLMHLFFDVVAQAKVVAAVGMILLALEDELNFNQAAREREARARAELEAYSRLMLARRRLEDFDRQGDEICQAVAANSRFGQAVLLLERAGQMQVCGAAGMDKALALDLAAVIARIASQVFLAPGSSPLAAAGSQALQLELEPWLRPGDALKRLRLSSLLAVPMRGRQSLEGVLLLAGMRAIGRKKDAPLRADDLLPIEMLVARLQATRSQTQMLEKLVDSEKFAGIGQLAADVTQQLNNPLTVILGYASLLEEAQTLSADDRKGVGLILAEARRMRATLASLSRVGVLPAESQTLVSLADLFADLEQLYQLEFRQRSIEFCVKAAPDLPQIRCNAQPVRQAILHCLQYAMAAVEALGEASPRSVRLEAASEGGFVQILIAHSGARFSDPASAFDPFAPARLPGWTAGLGLSLCASLLRDNQGRASAMNLESGGAAILLELGVA